MIDIIATTEVILPVGWIISAIAALCGTIATLAASVWGYVQRHIAKQDAIIANQGDMIRKLQDEIANLTKGCGITDCHWRNRP
jgi:cell division protein FtsL